MRGKSILGTTVEAGKGDTGVERMMKISELKMMIDQLMAEEVTRSQQCDSYSDQTEEGLEPLPVSGMHTHMQLHFIPLYE